MSDTREKLREVIARAILTPDESYYSDRSLFDTDWYERELALHRADCVLSAVNANKDLVAAVLAEWADGGLIDPSTWTVVEAMPTGWDWCATANKPLPNRANVDPCSDDAPLVVLSPREGEHERCPAGICRRPAGHAGPHSDLPREDER